MCGTASSQKCHVDLLQFVMLSIYHLFSRISIHLQRYFIKIRAAVHYFVQQTPLQDVLPLWNLFLTSVRVSGTIQAWTGTANGWYRTIKYRRIPGKRKLRFRVGNLSAVRQRTESIGFSPLRGSHLSVVLTELPEGRRIIILWWLLAMKKLASIYRQPTAHSLSGRSSHLLRTWLIITGMWLKNACSIFKGRDSLRAALNACRSYGCIVTDAERNEQELRVHNFWVK